MGKHSENVLVGTKMIAPSSKQINFFPRLVYSKKKTRFAINYDFLIQIVNIYPRFIIVSVN